MGLYTKVNGTTQEITQLSVNVSGIARTINAVYTQVDGVRRRIFPSTEIWTLVYESTTPGEYSYNADWGSYQIVMSGGGGAGATCIREKTGAELEVFTAGYAAEEKTNTLNVFQNETKTFSGTIGSGASGGTVSITGSGTIPAYQASSSYGAVGNGYQNGGQASNKYAYTDHSDQKGSAGWVGGPGGGSTSLLVDNVLHDTAAGGNGGTVMVNYSGYKYSNGGAGGNGGTTSGTGANGGVTAYWFAGTSHGNGSRTGGSGANGYVRIYKSNILPEPTTILNLSGGQKYDEDTVFPAGRYRITVQAGSCYPADATYASNKITQTINVTNPFIIRAYCGSSATSAAAGTNPYSGSFKVNARTDNTTISTVNHIFGNAGSCFVFSGAISYSKAILYSSGNCLGDGAYMSSKSSGIGAGSCLHLMPVGGTFGTDYLFAFHCAAGTYGSAGGGSAYGGAGSGQALSGGTAAGTATVIAGGSTPYGTGGAGHSVTRAQQNGYNGSGIGYGYGGGISGNGAGAWFDGTTWIDSRTVGAPGEQGIILIQYYG